MDRNSKIQRIAALSGAKISGREAKGKNKINEIATSRVEIRERRKKGNCQKGSVPAP